MEGFGRPNPSIDAGWEESENAANFYAIKKLTFPDR
jgi:hypothetical protein